MWTPNIARQLGVETLVTLEKSASITKKSATTLKKTNVEGTPLSMRTFAAPLAFNIKSKRLVEKSATFVKELASVQLKSTISTEKLSTNVELQRNPKKMVMYDNPEPPTVHASMTER